MPAPIQTCAICRQPLAGKTTVPTTTGSTVHTRCADREALAAARSRTATTIVSGALLGAGGWELAGWWAGIWELVAMLAVFLAIHIQLNRRWWQEQVRWALGIRGRRPGGFPHVVSQRFSQPNDSAATRRKSPGRHESAATNTQPSEDATC